MNILKAPHHGMTKTQAADHLGVKIYDVTLPQQWLDEIAGRLSSLAVDDRGHIYDILLSSIVWSYDHFLFGYPHPLTIKAFAYLKAHDMRFGTRYALEDVFQFNVLDIA
jgi:hypothetical protein